MTVDAPGGYSAATAGCAYLILNGPGYIHVTGPDRAAFFQRQTTNEIRLLTANRSLPTVLVSPTARIIDFLQLIEEGDGLGAITLAGRGPVTAQFLKSRIFFMDKVSLVDRSHEMAQVDLEGPQAGQVLAQAGWNPLPGLDEVAAGSLGGVELRAIGRRGFAGLGYRLLLPVGDLPALQVALQGTGCEPISSDAAQVLRVEAGLPAVDAELSENYTPLESGLAYAISSTKGCYTGQEVIARQLTYDKVTRHLAGIRLQADAQAGERVFFENTPAGQITSAAVSPRFGPIALAVLHRPHHQAGTLVRVGEQPGEVTLLPFGTEPSRSQ